MSAWSPEESHGIKASADRSASMGRRPGGGRRASEHCLGRGNKAGNNAKDHRSIYLSIFLSISSIYLYFSLLFQENDLEGIVNVEPGTKCIKNIFLQCVPKETFAPDFFCNPSHASSNP